MSKKVHDLLQNQGGNYIFPFFWQHGEDEAALRKYMKAIHKSNIGAVCVESRPHPDYCGPRWWQDMDVILDEARKRQMKIWILDDSHFPTGYANGAIEEADEKLCRQGICRKVYPCRGGDLFLLSADELKQLPEFVPNMMEQHIGMQKQRQFTDDRVLGVYAVSLEDGALIDLAEFVVKGALNWPVPAGEYRVYVLMVSRNLGYHRNYINMMDRASCKVLLDAVYEPHYAHYKADFGTTIAGFFSDEPELGNGHLYDQNTKPGEDVDFPWSSELEAVLTTSLGEAYGKQLILLWEQNGNANQTAQARYAYMNAVTRLVQKDFSEQLGTWCRERGVRYIGHLIEDNDCHARTGSSLGHYFRGLAGQNMAGIDDIGGQVYPQGEGELPGMPLIPGRRRDGGFYHYMLGKLAGSAAAIEPWKHGDSMCEIFGAYGWGEGVRLEKYLIDHFLVRGVNHYVPHAFTAKEFPDPDCPPHFYAHGHNPQYRHFGSLMAYTNRVCELIAGGRHVAPVAVLYHGEGEWTGDYMPSHAVGRVLYDAQIEHDYLPQDVFADRETYNTRIENNVLRVNTQEYQAFVLPAHQYITRELAQAVSELIAAGVVVYAADSRPTGICNPGRSEQELLQDAEWMAEIGRCPVTALEALPEVIRETGICPVSIEPADNRIRYYQYEHEDNSAVYLLVNEGTDVYRGTISIRREPEFGGCYQYDAWNNCLHEVSCGFGPNPGEINVQVAVEPLKSLILVVDEAAAPMAEFVPVVKSEGTALSWEEEWQRSLCRSIEYPAFGTAKAVVLPDGLHEEEPLFSGFVRYENRFVSSVNDSCILVITDAHEGVEVFINGRSLGIQIAPPFVYDLSGVLEDGENTVAIEVATTLEREMSKQPSMFGFKAEPKAKSGITGSVNVYRRD